MGLKAIMNCRLSKQSAALPMYLLALPLGYKCHQQHRVLIRHHYLLMNTLKHGSSKPSKQPEAQGRATGTISLWSAFPDIKNANKSYEQKKFSRWLYYSFHVIM